MKTRIGVAVLLGAALLAGTAAAQVHGIPASVTSFAPGRGFAPGIPASVTSLGPRGFTPRFSHRVFVPGNTFNFCSGSLIPAALGCQNPLNSPFLGSSVFPRRRFHPHGFFPGGVGFGGGGYAYPYPVVYPYDYSATEQPQMTPEPEPEEVEPQGPAPTIFDRRGVYAPPRALPESAYERYPERAPASEEGQAPPAPAKSTAIPAVPTVLVFRDGHRQEVTSYAIAGDTLYEIGPSTLTHKVKLADLDLRATVQANEANGIDFAVPTTGKPTHD